MYAKPNFFFREIFLHSNILFFVDSWLYVNFSTYKKIHPLMGGFVALKEFN